MLKPLQRVFPIALGLSLAACGGGAGGGTSTSGTLPTINSSAPSPAMTTQSVAQSTYGSVIMNDAPTAYYSLDDTGSTANDASGNGLNGTIGSSVQRGAAGLLASSSDTAMNFPGVQNGSGAVEVTPSSKLQPSSAVSLEALVKMPSVPSDFTVVAAYGQRSGTASYELYFKGGKLVAQYTLSNGYVAVASPTALQTNTTYDAVTTFDGTTAKLYLNGTLVASGAASGSLKYATGYGFSIGDDASFSNPAFKGTIDEVAVYAGKALSATQVDTHYTAATTAGSRPATPTPAPTANPTATPTAAPTATPAPTGNIVWQAGNAALGHWVTSNTYQCGNPVNNGTSFTFNLQQNGTNCGRNQASPTDASGNLFRLQDGRQYTWTFHYIDGTPSGTAPGMGYDRDARSLIFQVHPYGGGGPCVGLAFYNGGVVGQAQQWLLTSCSGNVWSGSYTPGEQDDWKIVMVPSQTASGILKLYRNGTLVANINGANYNNTGGGTGNPWWNFGPYKWRWELPSGGGSSLTQVNATINNMTLTEQ